MHICIESSPLYRIPSVLLQGDAATSSGIVKGSFFNPSKLFPNAYKLPSFGSGRNAGLLRRKNNLQWSLLWAVALEGYFLFAGMSCPIKPLISTLFATPLGEHLP